MKLSGQVEAIKVNSGAYGDMYNLVINGNYYFVGKYPPRGITQGDYVEFEYTETKKGQYTNRNIEKGTLRKIEANTSNAPAPQGRPAARPIPIDDRQVTISKQAAFNTALTFVGHAIALGAVPIAAKASAAEKLDLFDAWVKKEAAKFYGLSTGQVWEIEDTSTPEKEEAGADEQWPEEE